MKRKLISFILLFSLSLTTIGCNITDKSEDSNSNIVTNSKIKFEIKDDDKVKIDRDKDGKCYKPFTREELLEFNKKVYLRLHDYFTGKSFGEKIGTLYEDKELKKYTYRYSWTDTNNTDFVIYYDSVDETKDESYVYVKTNFKRENLKVDNDLYSMIKELYKTVTTKDLSKESLDRLNEVIDISETRSNSEIDYNEVYTISEEGNFGVYMTIGSSSYELYIQSVLNS